MDFELSEERRLLAETTRRLLRQHYGFEHRRAVLTRGEGVDLELWPAFTEAGLLGLLVPEAHGGLGAGGIETHLVMEAMGEALVVSPYLEGAVLAPGLITRLASPAQQVEWLPAVAEGRLLLVPACAEPQGAFTLHNVETTATAAADGFVLNGRKSVVIAGALADGVLVSARTSGGTRDTAGLSFFHVPRDTPGLHAEAYGTIHGAEAAEITLEAVRVPERALIGAPGGAWPAMEAMADRAAAALCAESVGIMAALLNATVAYLKQRRQFGAAIGSFQAVQHQMVDALLLLEEARSLAWLASASVHLEPRERRRRVSAAKHKVDTASRHMAERAVQLHGGMGMTDELAVGHFMRRLIAIQHSFGDADFHLRRFADASRAA